MCDWFRSEDSNKFLKSCLESRDLTVTFLSAMLADHVALKYLLFLRLLHFDFSWLCLIQLCLLMLVLFIKMYRHVCSFTVLIILNVMNLIHHI